MGNKETDEVRVTAPSSTYLQNYAELHPILLFWYSRLLNCFAFSSSKS
jgi:hypothetical protein